MRAVASTIALALLVLGATAAITGGARNHQHRPERKVSLRTTGSGWPACDPGVTQRSGYLDINAAEDKHYFYWMFEAKTNPSTAPVILWMTGGPGCSSSLAILAENGPCHVNEETGDLYSNPYSWNNVANVIYIDQPAGVGFSYANYPNGYDHNETMVSEDMYAFFQAFYAAYPQYKSNPLFIYGESYGGHYAPATAHRVWQGNQNHEGIHIPLAGLSVGNGMTDPYIQFNWYSKLSYQWCQMVKGTPCVSESTYEQMRSSLQMCNELTAACNSKADADCGLAMQVCSSSQMGPFQDTGLNVYDIRIPCKVPGLCYDFSKATAFLNRADVQQSLGVASQGITWQSCNMQVNQMFGNDWMRDFNQTIPALLGSGIRVMIYSGDVDFICNWLGNKAWSLALEWPGKASFNAANDAPWWVNMESAGRIRTVTGNNNTLLFSFVQVHDAGHMVPMNQPQRALDMVTHFVNDEAFNSFVGPQPAHNIPTASPAPTPSGSPATPAPSATPASQTFTQKVCTSSTCTSGCTSHVLPTGQCLRLQNGMSAIAKCLPTDLQLTVYSSTDCSGFGFPEQQPLNTCGEDNQGSYIENICSNAAAVAEGALPMLRRSKKMF